MEETKTKKKAFKLPDTYLIVFGLIVLITILGLALPSSQYSMVPDPVTGRNVVDPDSFQYIDKPSFGIDEFLNSLLQGFSGNALLILGSFCMTGFFTFIISTGALDRSFASISRKLHGREMLLVPITVTLFCLTGSTGMLQLETIALLPIALTIAKILNLDPLAAVAMIYCGTYSGYSTSMYSPANVMLAQQIADVEPLSGFGYRAIWWCISTVVTCWYVLRYAKRVRKDINNSYLDVSERFQIDTDGSSKFGDVTGRDLWVVLLTVAGFSIFIFKALTKGYGISYIVGVFLFVVILVSIVTKTKADDAIKGCIKGAQQFTYGGLLMGFAGAIAVIMTQTNIMHTIVHALSVPLSAVPPVISGSLTYIVNLIINFFIPSTSGKAPMVMPLMAPLADVVGLSRQISVSAYCLADAIGNTIIPTHGVLIAMTSMAGVPFKKWFKFQVPLFLIWSVLALLQITIGVIIGIS